MTKQYGFYFDAERCVQCFACELACKSTRDLEPGVSWRKVIEIWTGSFPEVSRSFVSLSCLHCAQPSCLEACPTEAIYKRAEDGIVLVDKDKCNGCQLCYDACPYSVPQFGADGIMQKCDFCLERGIAPACVAPCPADALFFGTLEELARKAAEEGGERLSGTTGPLLFIKKQPGTVIDNDKLVIEGE